MNAEVVERIVRNGDGSATLGMRGGATVHVSRRRAPNVSPGRVNPECVSAEVLECVGLRASPTHFRTHALPHFRSWPASCSSNPR